MVNYLRAEAYGPITDYDRPHPWAWRYWHALPPRGSIGIFMRSWNVAAVVARLGGSISRKELQQRLQHIRQLEESLVVEGYVRIKLWLRISPEAEQWRRAYDEIRDFEAQLVAHGSGNQARWPRIFAPCQERRGLSRSCVVVLARTLTPSRSPRDHQE